jgi:SdrD B-like domain/Secretion system C-terminal sorting domain
LNPKMKTMKIFTLSIVATFFSLILSAQTLTLGNKVWWDINDNGRIDTNEPMAAWINVNLFQDNNEDGIADAGFTTLSTYTDENGNYSFSSLAPGKYFVNVEAGWSHFVSTTYGGDPDNNINNDNNGFSQDLSTFNILSQTITLALGTEPDGSGAVNTNSNNTLDIGLWKANGLGDMVWLDNNGNGIQDAGESGLANVTVILKNSSGDILETTVTDANGNYFFYDPAGYYGTTDYQVQFVTPAGYKACASNRGSNDAMDSDPINGIISSLNVPFGKWDHSFDAGFAPITLPVKLNSFTVNLSNNTANLKWVTTSEINLRHFVIEKSIDGTNFSDAGVVLAVGGTTDKTNYAFSDNLTNFQSGIVYYRLRSVDLDGKKEYSETRIVRITKQTINTITISTYPNPVSNELRITIPANWQNKKIVYEVFNANGQTAKKIETESAAQTEIVNVSNLNNGFYIVKVTCDGQTAQQKIIKQ